MSRVLIVCADRVGSSMAGPAIRAWEMATTLSGAGNEVRLAVPMEADVEPSGFEIVRSSDAEAEADGAWADVIVVQGMVTAEHRALTRTGKKLVVDLYDPYVIETLDMHVGHPLDEQMGQYWPAIANLLVQVRLGDYFICANDRQRDFWTGMLAACGRVNPHTVGEDRLLRRLIQVAPFGIPRVPPAHSGQPAAKGAIPGIGPDDKLVIWAGGIYNWFDPLSLIRAWPAVMERVPEARLLFLGVRHPNPGVPEMKMAADAIALAEELDLRDRGVFFNLGWVPYARRQDFLLESDLGVSMHFDHLETRLSFRTRFLDYIWASLPVVATEGDSFSEWAEHHGTGRVVRYQDVDGIAGAISDLLADASLREACVEAVRAERERFTWDNVLAPLVEYCRDPWPAADRGQELVGLSFEGTLDDLQRPSGMLARLNWYRRREGLWPLVRRVSRRLRRELRARTSR